MYKPSFHPWVLLQTLVWGLFPVLAGIFYYSFFLQRHALSADITLVLNPFLLVLGIIGSSALVWVAVRHHASHVFFQVLYYLTGWIGIFLLCSEFLSPLDALLASLCVVIFMLVFPFVLFHNLFVACGVIGIAFSVGHEINFVFASVLLIALAVYDVVAVWMTRSMVRVANTLLNAHAAFVFFIPTTSTGYWRPTRDLPPGEHYMILGAGDVVVPALVVISVAAINPALALWMCGGMAAGIIANHCILMLTSKPIAALPCITLGIYSGLFVGALFFVLR